MKKLLLAITLGITFLSPICHAKQEVMKRTILDELVYRVALGNADDVKILVEKLGTPNAVDGLGWPLLAIAASRTDNQALPIVKMLVEMGADVNYHGGHRNYPIMFAVQSGQDTVVEYLLEKGANYRASDAFGMRVVDFARQSENQRIIRLVEEAIDEDILNLARVRTQAYLDKITYDLAYNACALQYYTYYYESGQDKVADDEQVTTMTKHKKVIGRSMQDMASLFRMHPEQGNKLFHEARMLIFNEMESMVSNRWRRKKGVGQPGDMEKRCDRLTERYKESRYNKDEVGLSR